MHERPKPLLFCRLRHIAMFRLSRLRSSVSLNASLLRSFTNDRKRTKFSVDRTGLVNFDDGSAEETASSPQNARVVKEPISPLGKDLQSYIKLKGPITLHDYMAQSLNHLLHGYYQGKGEVIGEDGDFITAPEISQLFGEMIGIWCLSMWQQMGSPHKLYLVELGPGKGTLMKDIMRTTGRFAAFQKAISVHMVELSSVLRGRQFEALGCTLNSTTSTSPPSAAGAELNGATRSGAIKDSVAHTMASGVTVQWHSFLHQVPNDAPVLVIGQEFLDAFPIHQFCYTDKGWREKLVDVNKGPESVSKKPQVLTTNPRIAAAKQEVLSRQRGVTSGEEATTSSDTAAAPEGTPYHFRFVLSPGPTPAVRSLLHRKVTTTATAPTTSTGSEEQDSTAGAAAASASAAERDTTTVMASAAPATPAVGDCVEISPLAIATCEDVAMRVVKSGGAALLVDYGEDRTQQDTLRAFYKHTQVHALSQPGHADMTADVDFSMCRRAALSMGAIVPRLLTQGEFLMRMGIVSRAEQLIELAQTTDEQAEALVRSLKYLVEPTQMGSRFKVLSIASPAVGEVTGFDPAKRPLS